MPVKGFSSITVPDETLERLKQIADETHRTVPKVIEHMLEEMYPQREAEG